MALKCTHCGKGVMYGHNVSHAKNRTRKIFKPNLHSARLVVDGVRKSMKLCTKCLRIIKGQSQKVTTEKNVTSVQTPVVA